MRIIVLLALIASALSGALADARADATQPPQRLNPKLLCSLPTVIEPLEHPAPHYPADALNTWSEGYALFMANIAVDGSVQDLETLDFVGPSEFRDVAAKAVKRWRYKPLLVNGVAVPVYGATMQVLFMLDAKSNSATHTAFIRRYKQAREKTAEGKLDEATTLLDQARQGQQLNHYELALSSFVLALIAQKKGDWRMALFHIHHATLEQGAYLDDETARAAMRLNVSLAARDGGVVEAVCGFEILKKREKATPADDATAVLVARLLSAMTAADPLAVEGVVFADSASTLPPAWSHKMMRPHFYFEQASAGAKRFRLVCTRTVLEEAINSEMVWTVPADAGSCTLFVFGDPGATIKLVEEW